MVQEIHQVLMDREDTCHRTCFSLQLDGNVLDNFAELKSIEGLQEGSLLKVVEGMFYRAELFLLIWLTFSFPPWGFHASVLCLHSAEPYTVREARIHVRHIRDLLKSLDPSDAYNGVDCNSLSFLSVFTDGDLGGVSHSAFTCQQKRLHPDVLWFDACYVLTPTDSGKRKKKGSELEQIDCTPPEHILPGSKERPLVPLQPQNKDWKVSIPLLSQSQATNWPFVFCVHARHGYNFSHE